MIGRNALSGARLYAAALTAMTLLGTAQADSAEARNWRINPSRTSVGFVVDGIGWPRTKGQFHDFDGRISINFDNPGASHVSLSISRLGRTARSHKRCTEATSSIKRKS